MSWTSPYRYDILKDFIWQEPYSEADFARDMYLSSHDGPGESKQYQTNSLYLCRPSEWKDQNAK